VSMNHGTFQHSVPSTTLGDLIERILDKGVVISGDIKIKLVEVELLTIQIRLVICSVERAQEIGIDWWRSDSHLSGLGDASPTLRIRQLEERLALLEGSGKLEAQTTTLETAHD
jgi:hypothetical protein